MINTKIILINGKKRSGKDYFGTLLSKELSLNGKTSIITSFADPIKDIICTSLGLSRYEFDELKNTLTPLKAQINGVDTYLTDFRRFIQHFGTDAMKSHFGENVWVDLLKNRAQISNVDYVIVPDFRFLCENISTITIKIKNVDIEKNTFDSHRSENELNSFEFKYVIDNTGYIDLSEQVVSVCSKILHET